MMDGIMIVTVIIKELAKESEGEFNYLGGNTEKHKTYSVLITKEV